MNNIRINGLSVATSGLLARTLKVRQELYDEVSDSASLIRASSQRRGADIVSFLHRFPFDGHPLPYRHETDNYAAMPVSTHANWLASLSKSNRKRLRVSAASGVQLSEVQLSDDFVRGVVAIFNESSVKQGRRFWHYGKGVEETRKSLWRDLGKYKCRFIAAHCDGELIGFVKLLYGRNFARPSLILAKLAHRDKYTSHALIAKCVEVLAQDGIPWFIYGNFDHGNRGSETLREFKQSLGFVRHDLPRYYVPLTWLGRLAMAMGLHRDISAIIPRPLVRAALVVRGMLMAKKASSSAGRQILAVR
jgi:hypothetical protein